MKDYYEILELNINASQDEIKKAFRIKAIKYHPDKNSGDTTFTQKFIDIKEAYDLLSNPSLKLEYDLKYQQVFGHQSSSNNGQKQQSSQNGREKREKQQAEEEKFHYDPYKQFYSSYDREQQETPQVPPRQTPWQTEVHENWDFFKLPTRIGKIIGGYSSVLKSEKQISEFEFIKRNFKLFIKITGTIFILALLHYFLLGDTLRKNGSTDPLSYVTILWSIVAGVILIPTFYLKSKILKFEHINFYIGINGFAFYKCKGTRENIIEKVEVNFNDVTDFISLFTVHKVNFNYMKTSYEFGWINRKPNKLIHEDVGEYTAKDDKPNIFSAAKYYLNKEAEKYWTVYLLDNMEKTLEENGYIEFNLLPIAPYIRLGIGFITFLKGSENFTYKFNEIKRIYTKGTDLHIEHKNFNRTLFFLKSGNEDKIPLRMLCNRQFFFKAMELLLGYKIA